MNSDALIVAIFGLLLFFGGLGMSPTQTHTATTCEPGLFGECYETTVESPNPARGAVITLGLLLTIVGFWFALKGDGSSRRETLSASERDMTGVRGNTDMETKDTERPTLLQERVREHREDENRD